MIPDPLEWEIGPEACENGEQGACVCVWGNEGLYRSSTSGVVRGFTFFEGFQRLVTNAGLAERGACLSTPGACVSEPCKGLRATKRIVTWLILPVVICLSQRLSHACLSINKFVL